MCGIAGIFSVERPIDGVVVRALLKMLDAQVHRGPDDWGLLLPEGSVHDPDVRALISDREPDRVRFYPSAAAAPAVALGARRLSILDVSAAGRMPFGNPERRIWVTHNGEIYNFKELRSELMRRGYVFRSDGDTEVLVHGYAEWGEGLVERLRGMFAFAVLDVRSDRTPRLRLARDRFGIKPLYWTRQQGTLQFASEVRALERGGLVSLAGEPRALHGFLAYGSVPAPWTTIRDVVALPPAHELAIDPVSYSKPVPRRYWAIPERNVRPAADWPEVAAETRRLLDESVRMHLLSDVPLGIFLSGGMDSAALVGLASRHLTQPLTTLCVTFDEERFSEGAHAEAVARRFGAKHVEIRLRACDFIDELPRIFAAMDQPSVDGVNTYFVAKAARQAGLTVVLSGVGGDEMFWGYPGFSRARSLGWFARMMPLRMLADAAGAASRLLRHPRLEKLQFLAEDPVIGAYLALRGLFPPARAAAFLGSGRLPLAAAETTATRLTPEVYARLEVDHYLANQLLRDTDVFGMAHSVEVRVPFLDHRLAEFLFQLPASQLLPSGGLQKPLLAHSVRADHPEMLGTRDKMGFTFPFDQWMRDGVRDVVAASDAEGPIGDTPFHELAAAFVRGRLHWSRFWSGAVLRAMERNGRLPRAASPAPRRRILFLLSQVYGSKGGIPVYNQQLLRAAAEGFPRAEIHALTLNDENLPADSGLRDRVFFSGVGPRQRRGRRVRYVVRAIVHALRYRPDLIVAGHANVAMLAWALKAAMRTPTALVAHGIEAWLPPRRVQWAMKRLTRILPVSRFTAAQMVRWGLQPEHIRVLPDTVDGEVFRSMSREADRPGHTLLTVARLDASERYKGVERVLEALLAVREQIPDLRYVIAGDGDDRPRLGELARTLGVEAATDFRGFVADEALPSLYNEADLFVMPSVKEGFGIVFLEALASGTPVIGGNVDGSADALLDGRLGRLVDPADTPGLAKAIVEELTTAREASTRAALRSAALAEYGFERFRGRVAEVLGDV